MTQEFKVDITKAVGHQYKPEVVACNRRDYIMYALSVGVPEDELGWLYELDDDFGPLPTYPLCLTLKDESSDVNSFIERFQSAGSIPGIPDMDFNKMVHGEQSIHVIHPFPVQGGRFKSVKTCKGVYDKGSGMVMEFVVDLFGEQDGVHYVSMQSSMFIRGYGGWGGPKGPSAVSHTPPPHQPPHFVDTFVTQKNQALFYRLSGDFNPLHADPNLAPLVGFPRPILHGLCSYGKCAHAITKHFANNDRLRFKTMTARFAQPVFPGETVEIAMWETTSPDPSLIAVLFQAKVKERNVLVLTQGYATLYKINKQAKL
ncbi:HotDog domain-containing protein [Sporodiniella umbellata]|nr:HotDog domain-containing protein [Sporodiniella umbellata]